jgi:hypothetical protein
MVPKPAKQNIHEELEENDSDGRPGGFSVSGLAAAEPHSSLCRRLGGKPAIRVVVND